MLAIRAGRAFDGEHAIPGGATVFVDGARIVAIEPARTQVPDGYEVVDVPDGTVLPGLIDTHVHLCGNGENGALERIPDYTDAELDDVVTRSLEQHLAVGVTTVRDLGDRRFNVLERRGRDATLPTIAAAGPPITTYKGHCWNMGGEVAAEAELRAAVRDRAKRGVDVVKIMASGGAMTAGTDILLCQFEVDELRLVVDEAHAAGLPVTAHAHGLPSVQRAVAAGVDGIEHCSCLVPTGIELDDETRERLAAQQIAVCPTFGRAPGVDPPPAILKLMERNGLSWDSRLRFVGELYRAGVRIVSGSDGGISSGKTHGQLPAALGDLVNGGMPNEVALATATTVAAEVCGLGDRKGRLRAGFDADLVVVDGDPFADIAALHKVAAVVLGGKRI